MPAAAAAAMPPLHPKTIYLNLLVHEKTAKLDSVVREKVGGKLPGFLGKAAGSLISHLLTPDNLASKLAAAIPEKFPEALGSMGIQADAQCVYRYKAFVVVRIGIWHVDITKLIDKKAGAAKAKKAGGLMACCLGCAHICCKNPEGKLDVKVTDKLGDVLVQKLPALLPAKLAEKGIDMDITAHGQADEKEYLGHVLTPGEYAKVAW